jgi:endopolyphosphatase
MFLQPASSREYPHCCVHPLTTCTDELRYNISGVTLDDFVPTPFVPLPQDAPDDDVEIEKKKGKKSCKLPENEDKPHCTFKRKPRYSSPEAPSRKNKPSALSALPSSTCPTLARTPRSPRVGDRVHDVQAQDALPRRGQVDAAATCPVQAAAWLLPKFANWTEAELAALESDDETIENELDNVERAAFITKIKGITPWKMKDLTINSYVKFARRLANDKKMWQKFLDYMFVRTGA